ncbi:hypothetical protein HDU84_005666 [Entophlyctis sp. JEL0112]|nr:hypothetical protein HDU84_005666 [Entophlyctis sp. JEL0112]
MPPDAALTDIATKISDLTAGFVKGLDGQADLRMNFEFSDLGLALPDRKVVLQGVSGRVAAGRMTAIMGPSGAGKTTFMNVLMGKVSRTSGILKINKTIAEMKAFRKIIGYVPQEDVMLEELTVRENIMYSARTRLPNSWSNKAVSDHVDAIIRALNLNDVAHRKIGNVLERGISGGQRKRVNIGMELAAAPLSVFLDEPTSGLDSTSALDVAHILSSISRLGLTIVAVIHQPRLEIFESFDDVLMIAPGGKTGYFGPTTSAQSYFEALGFLFKPNANPADILMDILSGRGVMQNGQPAMTVEEIVNIWAKNHAIDDNNSSRDPNDGVVVGSTKSLERIAKLRGATFLRQVGISHNRSLVQQSRHAGSFGMESFVGFLAGFIMGISAGGEFSGFFKYPYQELGSAPNYWFVAMYGMLVGVAIAVASAPAGVKVFGEEKAMYIREFEAGHNSLAYFLGKNISVLYRILLSSAHFVGIYYFLAQPPIEISMQFAIIFLNFFGIYGIGQVISMISRRENAPLLAVTVGLIMQVLCGFGPSLKDATNGGYVFVLDVGVNRWLAEAGYTLWIEPYLNVVDLTLSEDSFGYHFGNSARNLEIALGIAVGYRVISYGLFLVILHFSALKNFWMNVKAMIRSRRKLVQSV